MYLFTAQSLSYSLAQLSSTPTPSSFHRRTAKSSVPALKWSGCHIPPTVNAIFLSIWAVFHSFSLSSSVIFVLTRVHFMIRWSLLTNIPTSVSWWRRLFVLLFVSFLLNNYQWPSNGRRPNNKAKRCWSWWFSDYVWCITCRCFQFALSFDSIIESQPIEIQI